MITKIDVVHVQLAPVHLELVRQAAASWTRPGFSNIRSPETRVATLQNDALVGFCGQLALHLHLFGPHDGPAKFAMQAWHQRQSTRSDGGYDVDALRLDVKTSVRRDPQKPLSTYCLPVRHLERRDGWVYVLALALLREPYADVALLGWAREADLPANPASEGPFSGAYMLPAKELRPLVPMAWNFGTRP